MSKFQVGDRVVVYRLTTKNLQFVPERLTGKICAVDKDFISFFIDGYPYLCGEAHVKQCRRLVKKKKEIKINDPANSKACMDLIRKFNEQYRKYERTALHYQNELKNSVPKKRKKK